MRRGSILWASEIGTPLQKLDIDLAFLERRVGHEPAMKRLVGGDPGHHQLVQRVRHAGDGLRAVGSPDDQLGKQRVVVEGDLVAGLDAAVPPDTGTGRRPQVLDAAGGGEEAVGRDPHW